MSLLLCRREPVERPYYIDVLGIHVFSSQELCYVIFNHPLLVMEEFLNSDLLNFIRTQLDMEFVAGRMEKLVQSGCRAEDVLSLFLSECDYYTEKELQEFKTKTAAYRKLKPEEYEKARADYLFGRKQYGRASIRYEKLLEEAESGSMDAGFLSGVCYNLGAAYAQMFRFQKALHAYERSYSLRENEDILKRMYFLSRFAPELEIEGQYRSLMKEELKKKWDGELAQAKLDAEQAEDVRSVKALFKKDSIRRMNGAAALVQHWKQEYRQMV